MWNLSRKGWQTFFPTIRRLIGHRRDCRTATNIRSGAKSPVAGMAQALTLLAVILFAAPLVKNLPLAALAGILFMVAYHMGDWGESRKY
jgi:MFS superfamily sulfate permease-like transporter